MNFESKKKKFLIKEPHNTIDGFLSKSISGQERIG